MDDWRAVADGATLPAPAPRPPNGSRFGIGASILAAAVLLVGLAVRGLGTTPGAPTSSAIAGSGSASVAPSTAVPTVEPDPTDLPTGEPSHSPFPAAGGSCTAAQFTLGASEYFYGYGSVGSTVVFVSQQLRNDGGDCVLALPGGVGVATASSPFEYVTVVMSGDRTSESVAAGQQVSIMLQATWHLPDADGSSPVPCTHSVRDVARVEFPLATGTLTMDLGTIWHEVCDSPASVGVRFKN